MKIKANWAYLGTDNRLAYIRSCSVNIENNQESSYPDICIDGSIATC